MSLVEPNWSPSARELRQFGGIWLPAFVVVLGVLIGYHRPTWSITAVLAIGALLVSLLGLTRPSLIRPVYVAWMVAAYPVGWMVSHLLLAGIFFVVMAPVGALMRWFGYDPMGRKLNRSCKSYWVSHNPGGDTTRYFRQL